MSSGELAWGHGWRVPSGEALFRNPCGWKTKTQGNDGRTQPSGDRASPFLSVFCGMLLRIG